MKRSLGFLMSGLTVLAISFSCETPKSGQGEQGASIAPTPAEGALPERVTMNYPEPTEISKIAVDVSRWSGKTLIVPRHASGKVSVLAAEPLARDVAYQRFLSALDQIGLGAVEADNIVTIEPRRMIKKTEGKVDFLTPLAKMPDNLPVSFNFSSPTNIVDIIANVSSWSGQRYVFGREINGAVQILTARPLPKEQAYKAFRRALSILGCAEVQQGPINQIVPVLRARSHQSPYLVTAKRFETLSGTTTFNFPQPTEITDMIKTVAQITNANVIMDRTASGKVQILAPGEINKQDAYRIFLVALDSLGLGATEERGAIKIVPLRLIRPVLR